MRSTGETTQVRVRFAPSPTGLLHIGGLRTALYNYLFARHHGGAFVLRIEDTDQERYRVDALDDILDGLAWCGLEYDEGPRVGGPFGPYFQSERKDGYRQYADRLIDAGYAYYAFDTRSEIDEMRARLQKSGNPSPRYDSITRMSMRNSITLSREVVDGLLRDGMPHVIRLKVPRRETVRFHDEVRGWVAFESGGLDDQVLLKSDGMPTYHLANVVDDHLMGISHVIRGEEWLSSTPKHVLLYQYLGWDMPAVAHLPLILSPSGGKLSKRNADELGIPVSVRQYREAGYEPWALLNFLALLGWNPGDDREVFDRDGLTRAFGLDRVGSSGVQFNLEKLKWFNQQSLQSTPIDDLARRLGATLQGHGLEQEFLEKVAELMIERVHFESEFLALGGFFFADPETFDERGLGRLKPSAPEVLRELASVMEGLGQPIAPDRVDDAISRTAEILAKKKGEVMFPARLAITGMTFGPSLSETMGLLGLETCLRRLRFAATSFESHRAGASDSSNQRSDG